MQILRRTSSRRAAWLILALALVSFAPVIGQTPPDPSRTHVGDQAPQFTVKTLDGQTIDIAALKGKLILIAFWATWCPACQQEIPRLEGEIWQPFKNSGLVMAAIAREQTEADIRAYLKEHPLTMPFAADTSRAIYAKFATQDIPRCYLIGRDGRIAYQMVGIVPAQFEQLKTLIRQDLASAGTH